MNVVLTGCGRMASEAARLAAERGRRIVDLAARGRSGFAAGALLAAEWIQGRSGVFHFDDMLQSLAEGNGGER